MLLAGFTITSCAKEKNPVINEEAKKLVKFYNADDLTNVMDLTYDNEGRLISQAGTFTSVEFIYSNGGLSGSAKQNGVVYFTFSNGKLDNAGRLTQVDALYEPPNNAPKTQYIWSYEYNTDGYLTKFTRNNTTNNSVSVENLTYQNGNLVKNENLFNGLPNYTTLYEYYDNVENKLKIDIAPALNNLYTDELTGKRSHNLVKSEKNYDAQNVMNIDRHYDYLLDNDGFPVSINITNALNNSHWNRTLVYDK